MVLLKGLEFVINFITSLNKIMQFSKNKKSEIWFLSADLLFLTKEMVKFIVAFKINK